jgi:hypothetical protein
MEQSYSICCQFKWRKQKTQIPSKLWQKIGYGKTSLHSSQYIFYMLFKYCCPLTSLKCALDNSKINKQTTIFSWNRCRLSSVVISICGIDSYGSISKSPFNFKSKKSENLVWDRDGSTHGRTRSNVACCWGNLLFCRRSRSRLRHRKAGSPEKDDEEWSSSPQFCRLVVPIS